MTPMTSPTFTSAPSPCVILLEDAALRRRDLEIDLVGLELDEGVADVDGVPFLLQPLRDARVDDRLADFRDHYVCRHFTPALNSDSEQETGVQENSFQKIS